MLLAESTAKSTYSIFYSQSITVFACIPVEGLFVYLVAYFHQKCRKEMLISRKLVTLSWKYLIFCLNFGD